MSAELGVAQVESRAKCLKTKRRAVLAFCMDMLVRASADANLLPTWLEKGVPAGCYDNVPDSTFNSIAEAYDKSIVEGDKADEYWCELESLFLFTLLRGMWGSGN